MSDSSTVGSRRSLTAAAIPAGPHAFIHNYRHEYKVNSPAIVNGKGRVFWIKNLTKHAAVVTMPESVVGRGALPIELPPGGATQIPLSRGAGGGHTYSVVMRVNGDLVTAQGNSDPVIIIDPPCA